MILPDDIADRDVVSWLDHGVVLLQGRGTKPFWFMTINAKTVQLADGGPMGEIIQAPLKQVLTHWPTGGAVNLKRFAVHTARRNMRQWRRTFTPTLMVLTVPEKWVVMRGGVILPRNAQAREVVEAVFQPEYPSIQAALSMLSKGEMLTAAISPHVILGQPAGGTFPVYVRGLLSGRTNGEFVYPMTDSAVSAMRLSALMGGIPCAK